MNLLVAIVGPTGVGKSRLALFLAQKFSGEIVNADSRQVYRHMNIGTAKPGREELSRVPHHLIDIIDPDADFSLAQYKQLACRAIEDIQQRGKLPLLVGGSGLYLWTIIEGWQVPEVPPDPELRHYLEKKAATTGTAALYQELLQADPESAEKIDPRNIRRVIRALEVITKTRKPFSQLRLKSPPPYQTFIIGLTANRATLYHNINERVDKMLAQGFVAEVENLRQMRYDVKLPTLFSIGYRQIGAFLKGTLTLAGATGQIKTETHRLARHQYAWFRHRDTRINWFDITKDTDADIERALAGFLKAQQVPEKGRA
ncbi:tRNA (adenosine(37)-N6)-dimethylallyltransferase MiaA [Chloroflexota bacterium]